MNDEFYPGDMPLGILEALKHGPVLAVLYTAGANAEPRVRWVALGPGGSAVLTPGTPGHVPGTPSADR